MNIRRCSSSDARSACRGVAAELKVQDYVMTLKRVDSVYGRALRAATLCLLVLSAAWPTVQAQGDDVIVDAREALRKKDGKRLAVLRASAVEANHPLAML